jgi:hypothetical protein
LDVTGYLLPRSAVEAVALSDLLIGRLPITVQLLADAVDVTLTLQAEDPFVLHYFADGQTLTMGPDVAAAVTALKGVLPERRGDVSRVRAVFEDDGEVDLISAWDNIVDRPAPDAVLRRLHASLTRAWQGPGTAWVRTGMAASTLARVISLTWWHRSTDALDGLRHLLDRLDVLEPKP